MRYRISRSADKDIDEIWHYIARDSIEAADRVEQSLHEAMEQLAAMPGIGHPRLDVPDPRLRFWAVYS
jgi:plasmid stabilization system protein ParE